MKKIYFPLCIFSLLTTCKPELVLPTKLNLGRVDGIVLDATTGAQVPYATVVLFRGQPTGDIFGCCPTSPIAETIADSTGAFHFDFDFDSSYFYTCSGVAEMYFQSTLEYNVDYFVTIGNNVEVLLNPKAWINIHFQNVLPSSVSDYFNINGTEGGPFNGVSIDSFLVMSVNGNKEFNLSWFVGVDGITNNFQENILCPSFDTTYFEILY